MKTMKKIFAFVLIITVVISASLPVFADVIIEPLDSFYAAHRDECVYNNYRQYTVNTAEGHAYLYASPESAITVKGYPNGETVTITWIYTDTNGEAWGIESNDSGWFLMSDLTVIYDSYSFIEDHKGEMTEYIDGTYSIETSESQLAVMWNYPGNKSDYFFNYGNIAEYVQSTYTDESGTVWGNIGYYMGSRNVWVCMSDPYNNSSENEKEEVSKELKAEPTPDSEIPMSKGNKNTLIAVGALVGALVIATVILIAVMFARKNKKAE